MPKGPQRVVSVQRTDGVLRGTFINAAGDEETRILEDVPATWLRAACSALNKPAGPGTTNAEMLHSILDAVKPESTVHFPLYGTAQEPTPSTTPEPPATSKPSSDDPLAAMRELLGIENAPTVDPETVRQIVADEVAARYVAPVVVRVERPNVDPVTIEGAHPLLPRVLQLLAVRDAAANRSPYLHGPAGSGKSTLASQAAKALDLPFAVLSCCPMPQEHRIEGFMGISGDYVATIFYRMGKDGGVLLLDELDASYPATQVMVNDAIASRRMTFPNNETVQFHPDFHIIGAGNTLCGGADALHSAREQLDAATVDRYNFLHVPYSVEVERTMSSSACGDPAIVGSVMDRMARIRAVIGTQSLNVVASPRATASVCALLEAGWTEQDAWDTALFGRYDLDTRRKLEGV
jgi:cobaltochelatase CobS